MTTHVSLDTNMLIAKQQADIDRLRADNEALQRRVAELERIIETQSDGYVFKCNNCGGIDGYLNDYTTGERTCCPECGGTAYNVKAMLDEIRELEAIKFRVKDAETYRPCLSVDSKGTCYPEMQTSEVGDWIRRDAVFPVKASDK